MGFVVSKKPVEVVLEYVDLGEDDFVIIENDIQRKLFEGEIKKVKAKFERPRWHNFNIYTEGCSRENSYGQTEFDLTKLRKNKLDVLLLSLEDDKGEEIKLDQNFYDNVHPSFAVALVEGYDLALNKERTDFLEKQGYVSRWEKIQEAEKKKKEEEQKPIENVTKKAEEIKIDGAEVVKE